MFLPFILLKEGKIMVKCKHISLALLRIWGPEINDIPKYKKYTKEKPFMLRKIINVYTYVFSDFIKRDYLY